MLLAIDIGNTNVVLGVFRNNNWEFIWRLETLADRPKEQYELALSNYFLENDLNVKAVRSVVLGSVVPALTQPFVSVCERMFSKHSLVVGPDIYPKLNLIIENPQEIGADLVANSMAAFRKYGGNCIIVDFGTALTFTAITGDGTIAGVSIAPGLKTALKSLADFTAKLPEVPLEVPKTVLGKDTTHAMQAGILIGFAGLVRTMIAEIKKEINQPCAVIATGGFATILDLKKDVIDHFDPELTLDGLRFIHDLVGKK